MKVRSKVARQKLYRLKIFCLHENLEATVPSAAARACSGVPKISAILTRSMLAYFCSNFLCFQWSNIEVEWGGPYQTQKRIGYNRY